jgi:uncharacterized membrane protein
MQSSTVNVEAVWLVADAYLALMAFGAAFVLRPWRMLDRNGPPWPWLATWALVPLTWCLDRLVGSPAVPLLSLSPLLVLMAGWPLVVVSLVPVAAVAMVMGDLGWAEGLHRMVWLGLVPATLTLGLGAASRRWLPADPMVYVLGRGFFAPFVAIFCAGATMFLAHEVSPPMWTDRFLAQMLLAFSEAFVGGALVAAMVAFRPALLATYADRLYLR